MKTKLFENCLGSLNLKVNDISSHITEVNSSNDMKTKGKFFRSISKILGTLHKEFDKEEVSARMVEKYFNDPKSQYYQMRQSEILDLWQRKGQSGMFMGRNLDSMMQSFMDDPSHYQAIKSSDITLNSFLSDISNVTIPDQFKEFTEEDEVKMKAKNLIDFYRSVYESSKKNGYVCIILGSELDVYNPKYKYKGRLDALWYFRNIEDSAKDFIMLVDYKNTKKLSTKNDFGDLMFGPLYKYDDCDLNIYTIQLYLYKNALINTYGIEESRIVPRVLNVTADSCQFYEPSIPYSEDLIQDVMKFAQSKLSKK